ncbi:MAG: glycosyltransferase [Planctomycetota bacterium]|nr:MAG: glycosyltransferase [Planctomycetota bacterium]
MEKVIQCSAVVPVLNEERRLASCLQRLRRQTGGWQIIVVDGGSQDNTMEVARQAGADLILQTEGGRGRQLRLGAEAAQSDYLIFVHADTWLPEDADFWVTQTLQNPKWSAGAFRVRHQGEDCGPISRLFLPILNFRSRYASLPYGDQALFTRKEVYRQVGGMPEQELMEDLEFGKRLRKIGPIRKIPAEVEVSARRFGHRPWRSFLCWNLFPTLYALGVSPERLARWYGSPETTERRR